MGRTKSKAKAKDTPKKDVQVKKEPGARSTVVSPGGKEGEKKGGGEAKVKKEKADDDKAAAAAAEPDKRKLADVLAALGGARRAGANRCRANADLLFSECNLRCASRRVSSVVPVDYSEVPDYKKATSERPQMARRQASRLWFGLSVCCVVLRLTEVCFRNASESFGWAKANDVSSPGSVFFCLLT